MIIDDDSPEITKEEQSKTDPEKNLSINELKSRLIGMNIELDSKKHPKSYYVSMYQNAINELNRSRKNQAILSNSNKKVKTINNKIVENFMKIKRKRLDRGAFDKNEKYEIIQNYPNNQYLRFVTSSEKSNRKSVEIESLFNSETSSRVRSIKVSKITFPSLNDIEDNHKEKSSGNLPNIENLNRFHHLEEIHEVQEADNIPQNDNFDNNIAPSHYDRNQNVDDNFINRICDDKYYATNPLATKYDEMLEVSKPLTPRENVSKWSSRKDIGVETIQNMSNDNLNPENPSAVNMPLDNNYDADRMLQNYLEQQLLQQQEVDLKKNLGSRYSSKSQTLMSYDNFKAPRSSNSMIVVKQLPAKSNSSNSLRRIQIRESIINTSIKSESNKMQPSVPVKAPENINNLVILQDSSGTSREFVIKLGKYIIIFVLGTAIAYAFYYAYNNCYDSIIEYYNNSFSSSNQVGSMVALFGGVGILLFLSYLIKRNREITEKENKFIADNCFNGIKENLVSKRESGVPLPEIDSDDFIKEFCNSNNCKPAFFMEEIMPYIRENCNEDSTVEELNTYVDGVIKTFWKLKSDTLNNDNTNA